MALGGYQGLVFVCMMMAKIALLLGNGTLLSGTDITSRVDRQVSAINNSVSFNNKVTTCDEVESDEPLVFCLMA